MSLRAKFALLLALLGLTVASSIGTTLWAIHFLERELARPMASVQPVLSGLRAIRGQLGTQSELLDGAATPDGAGRGGAERFEHSASLLRVQLERLEQDDTYRLRAGISTTQNIRRRVEETHSAAEEWFAAGDAQERERARRGLKELIDLVHRVEGQVLATIAEVELVWAQQIRPLVLTILGASVGAVLIGVVLGARLVRRWILSPVAQLRVAAARLADGDFEHRLRVEGSDEIAMLGREVNHMAGMVSAMQEERIGRERLAAVGEMVRRIVHNLRNPLAGIRSLAELTRDALPAGSEEREQQERIMQTVDRFEGWLRQLLAGTRPLEIRPEPVDVREWLGGVAESLRSSAQSKRVGLELRLDDAPGRAAFDPGHLEQALVAVLSNAIEAAPAGSAVAVSSRTLGGGESWEIRVEDGGGGIPPERRETVFQPYFTTKRHGTGIGLALAKQVVEQHGGRISVEERASGGVEAGSRGPGTAILVRLPVSGADDLANIGQEGAGFGQDSRHRGRREPAVLDQAGPEEGRA